MNVYIHDNTAASSDITICDYCRKWRVECFCNSTSAYPSHARTNICEVCGVHLNKQAGVGTVGALCKKCRGIFYEQIGAKVD